MSTSTSFDQLAENSLFFLGHEPGDESQPIGYPHDHRPHLAYYGTTDSGKSFAMEYVLEQIADERSAGFCLIDPHGPLYWRLASYLRQHAITDRVLFWDINDPEYVVTYDPFRLANQPVAAIAGSLTKAVLGTLGEKVASTDQPQLKTLTQTGFRLLLEAQLPFVLSPEIFDPEETQVKRAVAELLGKSSLLNAVGGLQFLDRFYQLVPTYRRIDNVFAVDQFKYAFVEAGLQFKQLMEEGWLVLVNVAPTRQDPDAAYTFTRLLVSHLLAAAKDRDPTREDLLPFFLVIDEASRYLSRDVADVLTQTRKFGVYLMAGMQSLEQAKLEDPYTYLALRDCTGAEVVMRLLDSDEKLFFAKRFFEDSLTFKRVKHMRYRQFQDMVEEDFETVTETSDSGRSTRLAENAEDNVETEHSSSGISITRGTRWRPESRLEEDPEFYLTDQELQLFARWFSEREPGEEQRFGVVRVSGTPNAAKIEIPELPPPLYSMTDMAEWMRDFKASQPATLPLVEARRRFEALRNSHLARLRDLAPPMPPKPKKKSTTQYDYRPPK